MKFITELKKKNTINQIKKKNKPIRNTQNSSTLICTALFQYKYVYLVQGKLSLYTRQHFWNQQMNQTTIMVQIDGSKLLTAWLFEQKPERKLIELL